MKRLSFILGVLLFSCFGFAHAQTLSQEDVRVVVHELRQAADSLYIEMDLYLENVKINRKQSFILSPYIKNKVQTVALPKVMLNGARRNKIYEKQLAALSEAARAAYMDPYYCVNVANTNVGKLLYKVVIPFESWMQDARFVIKADKCGCGGDERVITCDMVADHIFLVEPYRVVPVFAFARPFAEEIKLRDAEMNCRLDFPVGKSLILPDYGNNPQTLSELNEMIAGIAHNPDITLRGITITGYASPEGGEKQNHQLSVARAVALEKHIAKQHTFNRKLFTVLYGGEDWEGLQKAVAASGIAKKEDLGAIVATPGAEAKKAFKRFDGGKAWPVLRDEILPDLRRSVCKMDFSVRDFKVEEAAQVVRTQPQLLSLNEMYLVSQLYEAGSNDFNELFKIAVAYFPNDPTANLNAALMALSCGDLDAAEAYLAKAAADRPESHNAKGILLMLRGQYDEARAWLIKAKESGLEAAAGNLEELDKKVENIRLMGSVR